MVRHRSRGWAWQHCSPACSPCAFRAARSRSRQFQDPAFVNQVQEALLVTGLPAAALEVEITESSAMRDADHSVVALERLRQIGVRVSIDDFGTGYSSLSYLKRFPVNTVKIDRSFVADLGDDSDDAAIVSAIIALAKNLAIGTIAEGVETEAQLRFLQERDCPAFQGFLYARHCQLSNSKSCSLRNGAPRP